MNQNVRTVAEPERAPNFPEQAAGVVARRYWMSCDAQPDNRQEALL